MWPIGLLYLYQIPQTFAGITFISPQAVFGMGRGILFSNCQTIVPFWLLLALGGVYCFYIVQPYNVHPLLHIGYCLLREGYTVFTMSIHCYILVTACSGRSISFSQCPSIVILVTACSGKGIPFSQCLSIVTFWLLLAQGGVYRFHNVHPLLHFGYCLLREGYTVFTMSIHCYILVTACSARRILFSQCASIVIFWLLLAQGRVYRFHNVHPLLHFGYCLLGEGYTVFTMCIHCYILVTACSGRGIPYSQCPSIVMPPTSNKLEGHIASGLFVRPSVRPFVTLFDA